jgi:hypothetical protein
MVNEGSDRVSCDPSLFPLNLSSLPFLYLFLCKPSQEQIYSSAVCIRCSIHLRTNDVLTCQSYTTLESRVVDRETVDPLSACRCHTRTSSAYPLQLAYKSVTYRIIDDSPDQSAAQCSASGLSPCYSATIKSPSTSEIIQRVQTPQFSTPEPITANSSEIGVWAPLSYESRQITAGRSVLFKPSSGLAVLPILGLEMWSRSTNRSGSRFPAISPPSSAV